MADEGSELYENFISFIEINKKTNVISLEKFKKQSCLNRSRLHIFSIGVYSLSEIDLEKKIYNIIINRYWAKQKTIIVSNFRISPGNNKYKFIKIRFLLTN